MQKLNDLSRFLAALEPNGTLIVVIEMSLSSWLVSKSPWIIPACATQSKSACLMTFKFHGNDPARRGHKQRHMAR
jgi:hypothetical protein